MSLIYDLSIYKLIDRMHWRLPTAYLIKGGYDFVKYTQAFSSSDVNVSEEWRKIGNGSKHDAYVAAMLVVDRL